jgi:hypothetical protein
MLRTVNPTLAILATAILFSENDENGNPLGNSYSPTDFSPESLEKLYQEYCEFLSEVESKITEKIGNNWNCIDDFYDISQPVENQTEYDYIMTRNRHGCGFRDGDWSKSVSDILTVAAQKYHILETYIGDDGKIHFL